MKALCQFTNSFVQQHLNGWEKIAWQLEVIGNPLHEADYLRVGSVKQLQICNGIREI